MTVIKKVLSGMNQMPRGIPWQEDDLVFNSSFHYQVHKNVKEVAAAQTQRASKGNAYWKSNFANTIMEKFFDITESIMMPNSIFWSFWWLSDCFHPHIVCCKRFSYFLHITALKFYLRFQKSVKYVRSFNLSKVYNCQRASSA